MLYFMCKMRQFPLGLAERLAAFAQLCQNETTSCFSHSVRIVLISSDCCLDTKANSFILFFKANYFLHKKIGIRIHLNSFLNVVVRNVLIPN